MPHIEIDPKLDDPDRARDILARLWDPSPTERTPAGAKALAAEAVDYLMCGERERRPARTFLALWFSAYWAGEHLREQLSKEDKAVLEDDHSEGLYTLVFDCDCPAGVRQVATELVAPAVVLNEPLAIARCAQLAARVEDLQYSLYAVVLCLAMDVCGGLHQGTVVGRLVVDPEGDM